MLHSCSNCATKVIKILIAQKNKTIINQHEFNGGVAQLVRAQDS